MTPVARRVIVFAAVLTLGALAAAQDYEGTPVKSGQAVFKYNGKDYAFTAVEGGFQQMGDFTLVTLVFKPGQKFDPKIHLNITLMYQGPGKVDLESPYSMSGIGMFADGDVSRYTKGKSQCAITLTKASPTEVEGIAVCPLMHNIGGEEMPPITDLKFSASIK
jgi:hypothetical protein